MYSVIFDLMRIFDIVQIIIFVLYKHHIFVYLINNSLIDWFLSINFNLQLYNFKNIEVMFANSNNFK